MKKLLSLLLVLALTMGLATAAFAAAGTYDDPHQVVCGGESITVTVAPTETVYVNADVFAGSVVSASSASNTYALVYGRMTQIYADEYGAASLTLEQFGGGVFAVWNTSETDTIDVTISVVAGEAEDNTGTFENPIILDELGWNKVSLKEADMYSENTKYYRWTAPAAGTATFYLGGISVEGVEATIVVTNLNTYAQRDLLMDGAPDEYGDLVLTLEVSAGDELEIQVMTIRDANWTAPAADITWVGNFAEPMGTANNPIWFYESETVLTVPAGQTYYFATRAEGITMVVEGANFVVEHNGETLNPDDGKVEVVLVSHPDLWGGCLFTITNNSEAEGSYSVKLVYPAGSYENPAEAIVPGSNIGSVAENSNGYYLTWTAPADGVLYAWLQEFPEGVDVDISLYNLTSYEMNALWGYDENWNDIQLEYTEVAVSKGDVVQIMISTRMNQETWTQPAADNIKIGLSMNLDDMNPSTGDAGILMAVATMIASLGSTVALVAKKKEF